MAYSDRELLARIVQCEAGGEGDNGMKAVATSILNRVNVTEGEYARVSQGGNLRNIIFQEGQYDCARETIRGAYNPQNIYYNLSTEIMADTTSLSILFKPIFISLSSSEIVSIAFTISFIFHFLCCSFILES